MRWTVYSIIAGLLAMLVLVFNIPGQAQSGNQPFAYLSIESSATFTVQLVDPMTLEVAPLITVAILPGESLGAAFLSPDSQWLLLQVLTLPQFGGHKFCPID